MADLAGISFNRISSKALNLNLFYLALFLQACAPSQESPAFMSTSVLIKDLLPPGPARAPVTPRKPEPRADSQDFGRVLEDSRQKAEPREKPVKPEAAKADAPRLERENTRRENAKAVDDRREARDRPEPAAKPASETDSASTEAQVQDGKEAARDAASSETAVERREPAKAVDKPKEDASASEPTSSTAAVAPTPGTIPETALTADLLVKLAVETIQPEAAAATAVVATQDQVTEAAKPADTAASNPPATAIITAPVPAAPTATVKAVSADADQPLQAVSGEKATQTTASATIALPTPETAKVKTASPEKADTPEDKASAAAKPEVPQTTHQTTSAAAKELARVVEQLAEPNTPTPGQPTAQTAFQTSAADALVAGKPQDPAHALARADAPVPLQAIAVEIGMRAMRGSKEFSIRLDPEDLGRIDIKLEISEAGQVQAKLVVERVETLQLLQRDAKTLERAFDQAGLKTNPDGLQFSLRDPGQQGRQNGQQDDKPAFASKDKYSPVIDEIALRPAIYQTATRGGLDIRI
jgi:flagellar hook-length control protein FliK